MKSISIQAKCYTLIDPNSKNSTETTLLNLSLPAINDQLFSIRAIINQVF